ADGRHIVGNASRGMLAWDVEKRQAIPGLSASLKAYKRAAWSATGKQFAGVDSANRLHVGEGPDVRGTSYPLGVEDDGYESVYGVYWAPDGTWLAIVTYGGVILWDVHRGEERRRLNGPRHSKVAPVAWSPDSRSVATMETKPDSVIIWDVQKGEPLLSLKGH